MSGDLDQVLRDASPDPARTPDVDALWAAGRRRRRARMLGGVASGAAALVAVGAVGVVLGPGIAPSVDPAGGPDPEPAPAEVEDDPGEEPATDDAEGQGEDGTAPDPDAGDDAPGVAPEPDPHLLADPCAPYEDLVDEFGLPFDGDLDLVIDVVAPVDGQHVSGSFDLVGCSRVFEATVSYRLLGPDGAVLLEDFTTAAAGGPAIGEFRTTVPVEVSGEVTVEVFWEDAADGSVRDPVSVAVVAE